MKARQLIQDETTLSPERLAVIAEVFEEVWRTLEERYVDAEARERARVRLAGITLMLARNGIDDRDRLNDAAVAAMARSPG